MVSNLREGAPNGKYLMIAKDLNINLILAGGQYRSGSTLIFNFLRELLNQYIFERQKKANVLSFYTDQVNDIAMFESEIKNKIYSLDIESAYIIIKTHKPSEQLITFIKDNNGKIFWTHRDPRDCASSFMTQFYRDFEGSFRSIVSSCNAYLHLSKIVHPFDIIYERDLINDNTINIFNDIALYMGINITKNNMNEIRSKLNSKNTKEFIVENEKNGNLNTKDPVRSADPIMLWHPNHIGDGRSGKYMAVLHEMNIRRIDFLLMDYMEQFNYNPAFFI